MQRQPPSCDLYAESCRTTKIKNLCSGRFIHLLISIKARVRGTMPRTKQTAHRIRPECNDQWLWSAVASASKRTPTVGGSRSERRRKGGTVVRREIRNCQRTVRHLIPRAPFRALVRGITVESSSNVSRWEYAALDALQDAVEDYVVRFMVFANHCAEAAGRVRVME